MTPVIMNIWTMTSIDSVAFLMSQDIFFRNQISFTNNYFITVVMKRYNTKWVNWMSPMPNRIRPAPSGCVSATNIFHTSPSSKRTYIELSGDRRYSNTWWRDLRLTIWAEDWMRLFPTQKTLDFPSYCRILAFSRCLVICFVRSIGLFLSPGHNFIETRARWNARISFLTYFLFRSELIENSPMIYANLM